MKSRLISDLFKLAVDRFKDADYKSSFKLFSTLLLQNPDNKEAKIGAIISDYANEDELDAISYFDYLMNNISSDSVKNELLEELTSVLDIDYTIYDDLFSSIEELVATADGIEYQDFKKIFTNSINKRYVIENIMFSTNLIISSKEEMPDFIELLYENNFEDEALSYLESAISIYPIDIFFQDGLKVYNNRKKNREYHES